MKVEIKGGPKKIDWSKSQIVQHLEHREGFVLVDGYSTEACEKGRFAGTIVSEYVDCEPIGSYYTDWIKDDFELPASYVKVILSNE